MLQTHDGRFFLDGEPFRIYSGAVHYFRALPEYWEDILAKLRFCGFNTVETYVPWNLVEKRPGKFDFIGMLDLARFLELAQSLGLYAILRPGPYICAEWDNGGLPAWLLRDPGMRLRCSYLPYMNAVERYFRALFRELDPCLHENGGNIIAVQVENEYGSYGNDRNYLTFIRDLLRDCGVNELLFTSDGPEPGMLSGGSMPGVFKTANFDENTEEALATLRRRETEGPLMCGEFWCGWFDHWGEKHHTRPVSEVTAELKKLLEADASFNFYMFYGGTNFGSTAGANYSGEYQPTVTSYDYDALLTEWGDYTEKYHAVRELLLSHRGMKPRELPPSPSMQNIGRAALTESADFIDSIIDAAEATESVCSEHMEYYGQDQGFILYRHVLKGEYDGRLYLEELGDRAHIFINGSLRGTIYRNDEDQSLPTGRLSGDTVIDILVEAMGRVNYGPAMPDRKGISGVRIDGQRLYGWNVWTCGIEEAAVKATYNVSDESSAPIGGYPRFFKGHFTAKPGKSAFVSTDGLTKGHILINGFDLGRYWDIGPQRALYLPGALLKEKNELVILELDGVSATHVDITDEPRLG